MLVIGGGPAGAATVVLAGRGRPRRRGRREEDLPPREDLRRRAHARAPSTSSTRWAWPTGSTDFHRYDGLRAVAHGITLELQWPEHPVYPSLRLRRAPPRPRHDGRRARGEGRRRRCCQGTEAVRPILRDGLVAGAVVKDKESGAHRGDPRPLRRDRRRRQLALRAGARHQPQPRLPAGHGHPRLLRQPAARRRRGSRAPSTSATATATRCPATAGSSRSATARSTSASACCRRSATSRRSTRPTS